MYRLRKRAEIVDGGIAEFRLCARSLYRKDGLDASPRKLGIDYALPRIYEVRRLNGASVAPLRRFEVYEKLILALFLVGRIRILIHNGNWKKAIMDKYTYTTDEEKGEYKLLIDLKSTKWSDGRTVQAADFVYAWKRIIDPEFRGDASSLLYDIRNARKVKFGDASIDDFGASAVDTYTLQVLFEHDIDTDAFFKTVASPATGSSA